MKKVLFVIAVIFFFSLNSFSQDFKFQKEQLTKIADYLIWYNTRGFVDHETGTVYNSGEKLDPYHTIEFISPYLVWRYYNGVINIGMFELGSYLNQQKYKDYSLKNYDFHFDNYKYFKDKANGRMKWDIPFGEMFTFELLDGSGAMASGYIDTYGEKKRKDARIYFDLVGDFMLNKLPRLEDGTFCRVEPVKMTVWADDLYMGVPFLARMGNLTKDNKYFDEAIKQTIQICSYLWDENKGLYHHGWYGDIKKTSIAFWGRANGWIVAAEVELLKQLPKDYKDRDKIISLLKKQLLQVANYQSESGLWHQLLDKEDSYLEASATAMFTYGFAYAVNQGFLPQRYITIALHGWRGIVSVSDRGAINNVCMGTTLGCDLNYYYTRHQRPNDVGFGVVISAGIEILKYIDKNGNQTIENRDEWD